MLLATITVDYFIARRLEQSESGPRRSWVALSVAVNLSLLAYCKYSNFFIDNVNGALGSDVVMLFGSEGTMRRFPYGLEDEVDNLIASSDLLASASRAPTEAVVAH